MQYTYTFSLYSNDNDNNNHRNQLMYTSISYISIVLYVVRTSVPQW